MAGLLLRGFRLMLQWLGVVVNWTSTFRAHPGIQGAISTGQSV